ncbi:MAG: hypothetical protein LBQ44_03105, partial [Treponema sp.]|nr:hypothetical protein [Treponema sp.]
MKILRTAALFLAAALFCSGSCESMPELKTQYPAADLDGSPHPQDTPPGGGAELSREEETGPPREDLIPEDESSREDLVSDGEPSQEELPSEPEPDASGPRIAEGPSEKAAVNLPEEEPEQGEAADSGLSEPEFEFAQSDYPPQPPAESGSTEAEALPAPEP